MPVLDRRDTRTASGARLVAWCNRCATGETSCTRRTSVCPRTSAARSCTGPSTSYRVQRRSTRAQPRCSPWRSAGRSNADVGALGDGGILFEPELQLAPKEPVAPNLAGWPVERMPELPDTACFTLVPDWVCEVLSRSTEKLDRDEKLRYYAEQAFVTCGCSIRSTSASRCTASTRKPSAGGKCGSTKATRRFAPRPLTPSSSTSARYGRRRAPPEPRDLMPGMPRASQPC